MPLGHRKLSTWYTLLAQQLEAGLPFAEAVLSSGGPRRAVETMAAKIIQGGSVGDALNLATRWLPFADQHALAASAAVGRMPLTLRSLASRHEQLAAAKQRVVVASIYPLLVLHVGLLLFPLTRMIDWEKGFSWSASYYLHTAGVSLFVLWCLIGALIVLARRHHPLLAAIVRFLPALGEYSRAQALSDFAFVLGNFLSAGVPIGAAWSTAGLVSSSASLQQAARSMETTIAAGQPPGPELSRWRCFPPDFVALYRTGEKTGQLEAMLSRISAQNQDNAARALGRATFFYPLGLSLVVAAGAVYFIVTFYAGYLKMISGLAS